MLTSIMTPASRTEALAKMSDEDGLDILVIGGGVTGAGVALEAATRGLRVGIVEAQDWASGTSSRSTKLVHGGLRYLQMLDFHLVHEALTERDLLITQLAPHLVKPVAFLLPLEHRVWQRAYVRGRRRALRHPGDSLRAPAGPALPPAPVAQGLAPPVPRPAPRRGRRSRPVLGRLRRRRPPGPHPGPHGSGLRSARRLAHPARGAHEERRPERSTVRWSSTSRPVASCGSGPAR